MNNLLSLLAYMTGGGAGRPTGQQNIYQMSPGGGFNPISTSMSGGFGTRPTFVSPGGPPAGLNDAGMVFRPQVMQQNVVRPQPSYSAPPPMPQMTMPQTGGYGSGGGRTAGMPQMGGTFGGYGSGGGRTAGMPQQRGGPSGIFGAGGFRGY